MVHAPRLVLDDLRQASVGRRQLLGFEQQLRGVADSTQRIADLVGDAGGQAAEGDQFHFLGVLGDLGNVLYEHQGVQRLAVLQAGEARLQGACVLAEAQALRAAGGVVAPLAQAFEQLGADAVQRLVADRLAEHLPGAGIGQQHVMLRIEHQDAGAHALQDQAVEGLQIGHVVGALARQPFADLQAAGQALHSERHGETQGAQRAGLDELAAGGRLAEAQLEGQQHHGQRGHRGDQQAAAAGQQQVGDGHGDDHQAGQAAGHAAGGVEQRAEQEHVEQRDGEELRTLGALHQQRGDDVEDQVGPAAEAKQPDVGQFQQAVVEVAGNQQHQQQADAQAIEMVQAQRPLAGIKAKRDAKRNHG